MLLVDMLLVLLLFVQQSFGEPCVEIDIERDFEDEGIPDYENLCYVITSPADQIVFVEHEQSLDPDDVMMFYNGNSDAGERLTTFRGDYHGQWMFIRSIGTQLYLKYIPAGPREFLDFHCDVAFESPPTPVSLVSSGTVLLHGYDNNRAYSWQLQSDSNRFVYLRVVNFETELNRDVLRGLLNDRFGEVALEWSGQKSPGHLAILPSERVYLHFYTDHVTSMDGFELQFTSGLSIHVKSVSYQRMYTESHHPGHVLSSVMDVPSLNICFWKCQTSTGYVGINAISISNVPPRTCQLLSQIDAAGIIGSSDGAVYVAI